MEFTNVSNGPRGLNTKHGQVIVAPRQTVDVEIDKVEADGALATKWFVKGGAPADEPADDVATLKAQLSERDQTIATLNQGITERDATIDDLKAQLAAKEAKPSPEAKHRGGGSYSIMDGDTELVEKLDKDAAEKFNAMDDAAKAAFIEANKKG